MGGGDLNLKKSWHPHTMKNQEKVWKAEQADANERRKVAELQREISHERNREELKRIGQTSGVLASDQDNKKLEWMYKGSGELLNREDYLLGRTIDKNFEQLSAAEKEDKQKSLIGVTVPKNHVEYECVPFSIRAYRGAETSEQVDMQRKLMEDPLMAIKQKEMETRRKILENPVKLRELHRMLKTEQGNDEAKSKEQSKNAKNKKSKKQKKKKKKRSRSESSRNSSEKDLDAILAKKYMKVQEEMNKDEPDNANLDFNELLNMKYEKLSKELDKVNKKKQKNNTETDNHKKMRRDSSDSSVEFNRSRRNDNKANFKFYGQNKGPNSKNISNEYGRPRNPFKVSNLSKRSTSPTSNNISNVYGRERNPFKIPNTSNRDEGPLYKRQKSPAKHSKSPRQKSPARRLRSPIQKSPARRSRSPRQKYPSRRSRSPQQKTSARRSRSPRQKSAARRSRSPKQNSPVPRSRTPRQKYPIRRSRSPRQSSARSRSPQKKRSVSRQRRSRSRESYKSAISGRKQTGSSKSKSSKDQNRSSDRSSDYDKPSTSVKHMRYPEKPKHLDEGNSIRSSASPASDSSKISNDSPRQKKNYGLVTADGKKIALRNDIRTNQKMESKSSTSRTQAAPVRQPKHKLTEKEKQQKLAEMMQNAEWRETDREKHVKIYRKEAQDEGDKHTSTDFDRNFINKELHKALVNQKTVESRLKSNINNIQRSRGDMDRNFAKR